MLGLLKNSKLINNVTSLFIGENSKKREIGFIIASVLMTLHLLNIIDAETFQLYMELDGVWLGIAFRSKLAKLAKSTIGLKEREDV